MTPLHFSVIWLPQLLANVVKLSRPSNLFEKKGKIKVVETKINRYLHPNSGASKSWAQHFWSMHYQQQQQHKLIYERFDRSKPKVLKCFWIHSDQITTDWWSLNEEKEQWSYLVCSFVWRVQHKVLKFVIVFMKIRKNKCFDAIYTKCSISMIVYDL